MLLIFGRACHVLVTLRHAWASKLLYLFENYVLDRARRELRRGGDLVPIEPQVFDLLHYLIEQRDRVVSRDDLIAAVWGGRIVSESALSTQIGAARNTVGDSGEEQRLIRTFPRKGVRFIGTVREEMLPPPLPLSATDALTLPDKPSIAVLPFTNMSGDPEQDYFAEGMAEEIITALSRCNWLFVIARNSSFTYRGKNVDIRQVGRELGVRYVVQGSVRRSGNQLRFSGQLIDATSGAHIWADRFDGQMTDVFGLQDQFTGSVVAAIEPTVQLAEIGRLKRKPTASLDAYDLFLRGQQLEYEFTEESLAAALQYLRQALAIDPGYAPAMALAGYCYAVRRNQGWAENPEAEVAEGLSLIGRAIELGNEDANVMWMAARAVWHLAEDAHRARELGYRSLQLNPNSAVALAMTAWAEVRLGNSQKCIELCARAARLNPRDPRGWLIANSLGIAHFIERRFDQAAACFESALLRNPRFAIALRNLAATYAMLGEEEKAAAIIREVLKLEPHLTLGKLRQRAKIFAENWHGFADGLRMAGLPE
jgi:TolB-like protein/tetratricopeptide (TPR) repeat protein